MVDTIHKWRVGFFGVIKQDDCVYGSIYVSFHTLQDAKEYIKTKKKHEEPKIKLYYDC